MYKKKVSLLCKWKNWNIVREITLLRVIHKVNLREQADIHNLKLKNPKEIQTTLVFFTIQPQDHKSRPTSLKKKKEMKHKQL